MGQGRLSSESGFTIIELLVVVIILGILAAVAIPNFLNQTAKAHDVDAKSDVRLAETAMEEYEMEHHTYYGASSAALAQINPTLNDAHIFVDSAPITGGYVIHADTTSGDPASFTISRSTDGQTSRTCNTPGEGGCKDDGAGNGYW